ncbi:MAG TPA: nuclear transport factor 2 family protein [Pyrinomonadaceae bacterium]|nr:nuclear transport factor 2 family protein [Pyrinomonadaceae bacterium]
MKTVVVILGQIFLLSAFVTHAQEAPLAQNDGVEQRNLIDLSVQLMGAVERKDGATLERLVAEDFFVTSPGDLATVPRADWIANSVSMNWENPEFRNFRVNVYGDTAIVTSVMHFKVSGGKAPFPIITDTQLIDVWKRRNGQWQIAARHLGAYSIGGYLRLAAGFIVGLVFSLLIWILVRMRRRFATRKNAAV